MCRLSRHSGSLKLIQTSGPAQTPIGTEGKQPRYKAKQNCLENYLMQNVSYRSTVNRAFPLLRSSWVSGQSSWYTWTASKFMKILLRQWFETIRHVFPADELLLSIHFSGYKNFIRQMWLEIYWNSLKMKWHFLISYVDGPKNSRLLIQLTF